MDLQISVFLLYILFTAGNSLSCYECKSLTGSCADQTVKTCPSGSQCSISTEAGAVASKNCTTACQNRSMNVIGVTMAFSCCNTDLCNAQVAPDPLPNGKSCFSCDDMSCSNTLNCSGIEDRCIKATGTSEGRSVSIKGCASKSICDASSSVSGAEYISCCEGNLCNGVQSVSQSFLFLCCSLISYFLLH